MVRVSNVEIPQKSRVVIALQSIHGIGSTSAHKVCEAASIPLSSKVQDLSEQDLAKIRSIIEAQFVVEGDKRKEVAMNIKHKRDIKCYQGIRHMKKLPVRGQNTKCNSRTRKGKKSIAVAGKKKPPSKK